MCILVHNIMHATLTHMYEQSLEVESRRGNMDWSLAKTSFTLAIGRLVQITYMVYIYFLMSCPYGKSSLVLIELYIHTYKFIYM